jgi:hypothetical protein
MTQPARFGDLSPEERAAWNGDFAKSQDNFALGASAMTKAFELPPLPGHMQLRPESPVALSSESIAAMLATAQKQKPPPAKGQER